MTSPTTTQDAREAAFYRCAYKYPNWRPGQCGYSDGFARTHWMEQKSNAESMLRATTNRGGEAFIEEREFV